MVGVRPRTRANQPGSWLGAGGDLGLGVRDVDLLLGLRDGDDLGGDEQSGSANSYHATLSFQAETARLPVTACVLSLPREATRHKLNLP